MSLSKFIIFWAPILASAFLFIKKRCYVLPFKP